MAVAPARSSSLVIMRASYASRLRADAGVVVEFLLVPFVV
jgi:hypothetical protein